MTQTLTDPQQLTATDADLTNAETAQAPTTEVKFTARTLPWTKLGTVIDGHVTAAEAAKLGGIDFRVREEPLYFATKVNGAPPKFTKIPSRKALVRDDTGDWLSVVSTGYPVVQYAEAFDFMDAVSSKFVAAGALRGGRQGFMVVETDEKIVVPGNDPHTLYVVLRTSHDCSRAVEAAAMTLRHVCMNQLTMKTFIKGAQHRWSIVHAGDVRSKLAAATDTMLRLNQYAKIFSSNAERLVNIKVSGDRAVETLRWVLPNRPKREDQIATIMSAFNTSETVGYEGTGWGLVNAVSDVFEHGRALGTPESRFVGALQGPIHNAINKTATYLLTRAN